jgi:phage-related minor tail protein
MRKAIFGALTALLLMLPLAAGAQQESVAEAARKAREQKKAQTKPVKVITNDDLSAKPGQLSLPSSQTAQAAEPGEEKPAAEGDKGAKAGEKGEAYWRKRFADARTKITAAEKELDILQRELNLKQMQYYPDPGKGLDEQYTRKEVNEWTKKIDDKKKEVEQLRKKLSDLEDELRHSGGDPGWARE